MSDLVINVDMDKKCIECGQGGAVSPNDICLACMNRAVSGKKMKTEIGRLVQKRHFDNIKTIRRLDDSKVQ